MAYGITNMVHLSCYPHSSIPLVQLAKESGILPWDPLPYLHA